MSSDVVVVGGGVVGCACALALAGRGLEVVVLERAGLAAGASGRNRGLLLPHPDPAFDLLYREDVAGYRRLAEQAGVPVDLRPAALLVVAGDGAGLAEAERLAVALAGFGHAVEPLDPGVLATLEPCLAPDLAGGYRQDEGFQVDPTAATLAFAAAARRAGAVFHTHDQAHRLLVDGGRVTGVATDSGPRAAGAVVLATGPWTRRRGPDSRCSRGPAGTRWWARASPPRCARTPSTLRRCVGWPGGRSASSRGWPASRWSAPGRACAR
jgi:D-hydroxyproline dehydrogenase subunit beta